MHIARADAPRRAAIAIRHGNDQRFSVEEWKQALRYLHTWPPAFQQQIARLRGYFVTAPPPAGALDLTKLPGGAWADQELAAAINLITTEPALLPRRRELLERAKRGLEAADDRRRPPR